MLAHILGDFYFQTNKLSEKKNQAYQYVAWHGMIYTIVFYICGIAVWSAQMAVIAGVLSLAHFLIDSAKYIFVKKRSSIPEVFVFSADQLLHLAVIAVVALVAAGGGYELHVLGGLRQAIVPITENLRLILGWGCVALVICRPANITIKQLLGQYKPRGANDDSIRKAGAFIGTLERVIIVLLLSVSQYSAIGLVLAAKSVARYDKISKEQAFSEYYLLGTLLSTLFVIAAYFVFI
jgi:hypothetical protein